MDLDFCRYSEGDGADHSLFVNNNLSFLPPDKKVHHELCISLPFNLSRIKKIILGLSLLDNFSCQYEEIVFFLEKTSDFLGVDIGQIKDLLHISFTNLETFTTIPNIGQLKQWLIVSSDNDSGVSGDIIRLIVEESRFIELETIVTAITAQEFKKPFDFDEICLEEKVTNRPAGGNVQVIKTQKNTWTSTLMPVGIAFIFMLILFFLFRPNKLKPQSRSCKVGLSKAVQINTLEGATSSVRKEFELFLEGCKQLIVDQKLPQPKCFISYCWGSEGDEREQLQKQLTEFRHHLQTLGATVYLDLANLAANINEFMAKIQECEFIFLIGTPALKERLQESGVNNLKTELSHIESRLSTKTDCLLPLIFRAEGDFNSALTQTMPEQFIKKHNILVRDCRQQDNEWTEPDALTTYIYTLTEDGSGGKGALGLIPIIYYMSSKPEVMKRYALLFRALKNGLDVNVSKFCQYSGSAELTTNRNTLFSSPHRSLRREEESQASFSTINCPVI